MTVSPTAGRAQSTVDAVVSVRDGAPPALFPETGGVGLPRSTLEFLDGVTSDTEKTNNARRLLKSLAAAVSWIVLSLGFAGAVIVAMAMVVVHYTGFGVATGGVIVGTAGGGVAGVAWIGRNLRKRRKVGQERSDQLPD